MVRILQQLCKVSHVIKNKAKKNKINGFGIFLSNEYRNIRTSSETWFLWCFLKTMPFIKHKVNVIHIYGYTKVISSKKNI